MSDVDFDVGIIGGGPAGSAMGAYLARAGVRCVIFEREIFPRPHVGESLVPSSTRIFKELDFLKVMEAHRFPRKYGATWTSSPLTRPYRMDWEGLDADCRADIRFEERDQPGVDQNYTYHVDRGEFDLALLQHANEGGATVYQGVDVRHVAIDDGADPEIRFRMGRRDTGVKVRLVCDASGRRTLLGSQLKLKVKDPVFDQYALHTWFEGFDRGDGPEGGYIHIHFLPLVNTWVWQIPIRDGVTSIGVVTQKKHFMGSKESRQDFFWSCLRTREDLAAKLDRARQMNPLREEGDYSYAMTQFTGDRFLLLGDAARFVDPIFSTGVSIALNSARFASRDVLSALERGALARESFQTFETTMKRGVKNWYDFITVYYRLNVLFSHFVSNPKYRLDVLKLLQGDVYEEGEPPVLREMREKVREVEENPRHMWHGVLGDLTANAFRDLAT
jgi:1H-pyrrole-2-carbonyl-[peptidyl-carrier protein] chlorinase